VIAERARARDLGDEAVDAHRHGRVVRRERLRVGRRGAARVRRGARDVEEDAVVAEARTAGGDSFDTRRTEIGARDADAHVVEGRDVLDAVTIEIAGGERAEQAGQLITEQGLLFDHRVGVVDDDEQIEHADRLARAVGALAGRTDERGREARHLDDGHIFLDARRLRRVRAAAHGDERGGERRVPAEGQPQLERMREHEIGGLEADERGVRGERQMRVLDAHRDHRVARDRAGGDDDAEITDCERAAARTDERHRGCARHRQLGWQHMRIDAAHGGQNERAGQERSAEQAGSGLHLEHRILLT